MAAPATTAAILVLFDRAVPAADVVAFTSEVVRMTGRTVSNGPCGRCVLRERPGEGAVDTIAVTGVAARIHAVVARVMALRTVAEDIRCPGVGRVTHITLHIRADVILRLRACATVRAVTVIAATRRAGIVEPAAADEARRGMAEVTVCRRRHVTGVLAGCGYPMTGRAIVDDAGMIEHRADEGSGIMTDTAVLIGRHVVG